MLHIGVIESVRFGLGGYQDAMLGLSVTLRFDGVCGVQGFISGGWKDAATKECKWTEQDREKQQSEMCKKLLKIMEDAAISDIKDLEGKPVELNIENETLTDWRILTEALKTSYR